MKPLLKYTLVAVGTLFVILGIIGVFVPILQGFLFLVIGLYILSLTSVRLRQAIESRLVRFPRAYELYERYSDKIDRILGQKRGVSGSENDQKRGEGGPEA